MSEKSRTEYSARNTTVAMFARVIAILIGYLSRIVFTHTLAEDYVGINGLFTDILNVLALSELGVGTAITYALYKPIAEKDIEKQKSLMKLYRSFYRIVAGIVLVCGLMVIPFMGILINDKPQVEHLILIYLMYLFSSVLSYLMIYKRTLIDAHQLSYIGVFYQTIFLIIQNVIQMLILYFTRNFILYLATLILCTIGGNLAISRRADKMYPYLKEKKVKKLDSAEKKDIFQNIRAMLMHKIGNVLVNNTDNLLLSSLVGTMSVGRYSNYYLIIGSIRQVLNQMFQGITASVGNLGALEGKERIKKIFEASFFMGQWFFGLAAICLYEVIDAFVGISFGNQFVFSKEITLILCLNFYLTGMRQATLVFRDSMGVFKYDRYKAIPEAVINLVVSIILGRMFGTAGIFIGTMVSTVTTSLWVEPYMLYKHNLKVSSKSYFLRYFIYASVTFALWWGEDILCRRLTNSFNPWAICIIRLIICFVITNIVYLLIYHRTKEFALLKKKAFYMLEKRFPAFTNNKHSDKKEVSENFLSKEERCLFLLLKNSLTGDGKEQDELNDIIKDIDWAALCAIAEKHCVLSLLYDVLTENESVPEYVKNIVTDTARQAVRQNYRILFLSKYLIEKLNKEGIQAVLLKGSGTASFYPVPELRKTGDVDILLLEPDKLTAATEIFQNCGCVIAEVQSSPNHIVFDADKGIEVELHIMLAGHYDNIKVNNYLADRLSDCRENITYADCMGVKLPILSCGYHAYELLLHMLQHFLRAGFGLKLLCDWVVFWRHDVPDEEIDKYKKLISDTGLTGFSDMITMTCSIYMGLPKKAVNMLGIKDEYDVTEFLREILDAEEFGKSASDRMVMMRGNKLSDYIREFHHQMRISFPKAGKVFIIWPGLWIITFTRFIFNNHKIRNVSTGSILKKAGQRSRIMKQIRLWK